MPLVNTIEMFKKAYEGGYAIGAFNCNNMEIVQAITEAAKECNSPVILQCSKGARNYAKAGYLKHMVEADVEAYIPTPFIHIDNVCSDAVFNTAVANLTYVLHYLIETG